MMAITNRLDNSLDPCERGLLCFPLLLSENTDLMTTGLDYLRRVERESRPAMPAYVPWLAACVAAGEELLECVNKFGRLPVLNTAMLRASTAKELQWLAAPPQMRSVFQTEST